MAQSVTIYHNPRCSKSRQTLSLLQEQGVEPTVVEYLKTPPDAATLRALLNALNCAPRELMRTKESAYTEQQLDNADLSEDALIEAMVAHPILIERPIVINGDKAAIGRPPENVLAII